MAPGSVHSTEAMYQEALTLLEILEERGFAAMLVGGCVRDRLLGIPPKDYDIATNALPEQVQGVFAERHVKVLPIGLKHGTVTVMTKAGPIEVTTLRKDVATDGRRAEVSFTADFREDASRRDFTVNAMFSDRHGQIFDYFEGQRHLREGKLVFVGDPSARITEDYLRIMRCFRFRARFGFSFEASTLSAIAQHKEGLRNISAERLTHELWETFACTKIGDVLEGMLDSGVFALFMPEPISREAFLQAQGRLDQVDPGFRACARLALALLWGQLAGGADAAKPLRVMLKLSNKDQKRIEATHSGLLKLAGCDETNAAVLDLVDDIEKHGGEHSWRQFFLPLWQTTLDLVPTLDPMLVAKFSRAVQCEQRCGALRLAPLPVTAEMVMHQLGVKSGPQLGAALAALRTGFRNEEWHSKHEGLRWLRARFPSR